MPSTVVGTFQLSKALSEDSDFELDDPELAGVSFTVNASWAAQPELGVSHARERRPDPEPGQRLDDRPRPDPARRHRRDAVRDHHVRRAAERGWDGDPGLGSLASRTNPDGTATLIITDAEQSPTIVVTNTLTELFGTFGVAKQVDGDFDLDSPEIAGVTFTVHGVLAGLRPVSRPDRSTWC